MCLPQFSWVDGFGLRHSCGNKTNGSGTKSDKLLRFGDENHAQHQKSNHDTAVYVKLYGLPYSSYCYRTDTELLVHWVTLPLTLKSIIYNLIPYFYCMAEVYMLNK